MEHALPSPWLACSAVTMAGMVLACSPGPTCETRSSVPTDPRVVLIRQDGLDGHGVRMGVIPEDTYMGTGERALRKAESREQRL